MMHVADGAFVVAFKVSKDVTSLVRDPFNGQLYLALKCCSSTSWGGWLLMLRSGLAQATGR